MTHKGPLPVAWADLDSEQRACLQTISTAREKRRDADLLAWSEARRARDLDVPERMIAERLQVSRATLQRQLARRFAPTPDDKPPTAATLQQLPSQPARIAISAAVDAAPTRGPLLDGQADPHDDRAVEPPTQQPTHQPAETTHSHQDLTAEPTPTRQPLLDGELDPPEDLTAEPTPTRQPLADRAVDVWSARCLAEAAESELLPMLSEFVSAMPHEDVLGYWNALDDANRQALTEYCHDNPLHGQHDREATRRFAVMLHQLHVRLRHARRPSSA